MILDVAVFCKLQHPILIYKFYLFDSVLWIMIERTTLHLVYNEEQSLLFHYPSYSLLNLNDTTFGIIDDFVKGLSVSDISERNKVDIEDIEQYLSNLENVFNKNLSLLRDVIDKKKCINRITLHISNDCNLRCKYCYASGGSYNQNRSLMTKKTAEIFVDFCKENFDYIDKIVFFGGEPCLNIGIMEYICQRFYTYKATGQINSIPKFVIITNGTILNERLLNLIKRYISFITVSVDGEEYVNDYNRVDIKGNGSFKRIASFIDTVKKETDAHIQYEATYTNYHLSEGIAKNDIAFYFKERFGINGYIVDEININKDVKCDDFPDNLEELNICNLPECFMNIMQAILQKSPLAFCQIARKQFAVSTSGYIYPCHMDVGMHSMNLGHIAHENIFNSPNIQQQFPLYDVINKKDKLCGDCWAQNLCEACPRSVFYDADKEEYTICHKGAKCDQQRGYIDKVLLLIGKLKNNQPVWARFISELNKL